METPIKMDGSEWKIPSRNGWFIQENLEMDYN